VADDTVAKTQKWTAQSCGENLVPRFRYEDGVGEASPLVFEFEL
jgi:hypothetical protein